MARLWINIPESEVDEILAKLAAGETVGREEKEHDAFEQEMEYRIVNISVIMNSQATDLDYYVGKVRGFKYALALYRECREADKQ